MNKIVLAASVAALAAISAAYVSEGRAPVAPGVQHDWGTIQTTRSGRQAVHLVEVTLGTPEISLEASLAGDRITKLEKTSSQALRRSFEGHRVVAAVNGDAWAGYASPTQYAPNGVHVQAGELVRLGLARLLLACPSLSCVNPCAPLPFEVRRRTDRGGLGQHRRTADRLSWAGVLGTSTARTNGCGKG